MSRSTRAPIHAGCSLRQGIAWNSPPPAPRNRCLHSIPISSSVSRQSATKPGQTTSTRPIPVLREPHQRVERVRLQPLRRAEAGLERDEVLPGLESQLGGEQARGLPAVAVIGIAAIERAPRQAVEAHHQHVRPAVLHPVVVDVARERLDVARIVVEAVDRAQRRHPPQPRRVRERRVERRRGGGGRILRKERGDQHAVAPRGLELREPRGDSGIAVAHADLDRGKVGGQARGP